jgi:hypothetical protein
MRSKTVLGAVVAVVMVACPSLAWIPEPYSGTYMIFFTQPNSATLAGHAIENLQRMASQANGRLDGPVDVTGYADTEEADVSKARAEAVRTRLVELGVAPSRISVKWRGSEGRLVLNPPGVPEVQNRRVEINMEALCVRTQSCPEEKSQDAGSSRD